MMRSRSDMMSSQVICAAVLSAAALLGVGCKKAPVAPDDASLTASLNSQIGADGLINSQPIQAAVQGGVATLNGSVATDAQKTIAARDAASLQGIKSVVNNLTIAGIPSAVVSTPAPAPLAVPQTAPATVARERALPVQRPERIPQPAVPVERRPGHDDRYDNNYHPPAPAPVNTPAPPPLPTFKDVNIPAGSTVPVRMTQTLDSATTQTGDSFSGTVASDVVIDGLVAIPAGSAVNGQVTEVHEAAHFKGSSLLTVTLTGLKSRGERLPVTTDPYSVEGKGRGKNTAEKAGGGAVVGAVLGGIFGGGKGAAIGAAAGGGVGAGANAVTRGQQVQIASETVVRFHTAGPLTVRVRTDGGGRGDGGGRQRLPNE